MARILVSEKSYIDELSGNQPRNLMVICERLFLEFAEDTPVEEMAAKIAEKLQDEPDLLGKMLQKEAVDLLFWLWSGKEDSIIVEPYLGRLQQLHYLGFVSMENENLTVNLEAKDIFYFSIKSRHMRANIEKYTEWEKIIFGMLFYYGILDVYDCYTIFEKVTEETVPYEDFENFLMIRIIFWNSAILLRNQKDMKLFMASREVMDRNDVFDQWNEHSDLKFREYTKDEYINLAMGNGITNWDGIPELFSFVLSEIENDKYKAMLIIKNIVLLIQNGETYLETVLQSVKFLTEDSEEKEKELCQYIQKIFYSIPVYGQKGYSRTELEKPSERMFRVIDGGKH